MSSAILYLAIVAIWAVILVPLLLRRSHAQARAEDGVCGRGAETAAGPDADGAAHRDGEVHAGAAAHEAGGNPVTVHADGMVHQHGVRVEHGVAFEYDAAFEYGEVRSGGTVISYETAVEYESAEFGAATDTRGTGDDAGLPDDDEAEPVLTLRGRPLWSEGPGWHPLRRQDRPRPAVTRAAALQARRRLLTILVTLTIVMLALVAEGLAPAWMIVPPVGMLGNPYPAAARGRPGRHGGRGAPGSGGCSPCGAPAWPPARLRPPSCRSAPPRSSTSRPGSAISSTTSTRTPRCARSATEPVSAG